MVSKDAKGKGKIHKGKIPKKYIDPNVWDGKELIGYATKTHYRQRLDDTYKITLQKITSSQEAQWEVTQSVTKDDGANNPPIKGISVLNPYRIENVQIKGKGKSYKEKVMR